MESLNGSHWDVLISGTGIQQSLLALALSRSGKKILHVDKHDTYGASEAALSLQEAETWVERLSSAKKTSRFHNALITKSSDEEKKLSSSRAYSLSLGPTLVYTRSGLLPILVSSNTHQQLEFMAVGSWFVYEKQEGSGRLARVPNGREDIFADPSLTLRMKGQLMKFLRFVGSYEEKPETWHPHRDAPFTDFLSQQFGLPAVDPLMALCLSLETPEKTTTEYALPRIYRHLRSIGVFGPGFGAVIPKWGGLSEVIQVACRACAVGGGVYVLGHGIKSIETEEDDDDVEEIPREPEKPDVSADIHEMISEGRGFVDVNETSLDSLESEIKEQSLEELLAAAGYSIDAPEEKIATPAESSVEKQGEATKTSVPKKTYNVELSNGEKITAQCIVGCSDDLANAPHFSTIGPQTSRAGPSSVSRSISVVSSPLEPLFVSAAEGAVSPAGAVVVFPPSSLTPKGHPPVHIMVHSSDTGECPKGQCVIYASTTVAAEGGRALLSEAVTSLISTHNADAEVLWSLSYEQNSQSSSASSVDDSKANILKFTDPPLDYVFDDVVIENVQAAWEKICPEADDFMVFRGRGEEQNDDEEEDDA